MPDKSRKTNPRMVLLLSFSVSWFFANSEIRKKDCSICAIVLSGFGLCDIFHVVDAIEHGSPHDKLATRYDHEHLMHKYSLINSSINIVDFRLKTINTRLC